jgi:methyl-accepting chemotaxis protein
MRFFLEVQVFAQPTIARTITLSGVTLVLIMALAYLGIGTIYANRLHSGIAKITESVAASQPDIALLSTEAQEVSAAYHSLPLSIALTVIGLALLFAIAVFIWAMRVTFPLRQLTMIAERVAGGDLTIELQRAKVMDETGRLTKSLNIILRDTHKALIQVADTAGHLGLAAESLQQSADSTHSVSAGMGAASQAVADSSNATMTSVHLVQESLAQNSQAVSGISANIEDVAAFASVAARQGDQGRKAAQAAVASITTAAAKVHDTALQVTALGDKTQRIGEFTEIITRIADQTNLLALNAAIEAARAGDAGRGFAVVAEEVRKLAEESNQAARSITGLVKDIDDGMRSALAAMQTGDEQVNCSARSVSDTASVLDGIVTGLDEISDKIQSISAASEQITATGSSMLCTVQSVADVASHNAKLADDVSHSTQAQTADILKISTAARDLANMAQSLQRTVALFKV